MKLKEFLTRHHRTVFYSTWFLLALLQAYYTELMDDEAFYWMYSRYPAFGYYEHPPMIGIMIGAGYAIFKNELGVRLFAVVMNTATIYLIQQLLPRKNDLLFYTIVLSISITQLGGFIAAPDSPMIFFIVIFFHIYKSFLGKMNWVNTVFLGLITALMIYSKYHSILVIFFTLLSNPKLLTKQQAWLAGLITLLLLTPHFYWQWINDLPSLRFHLSERISGNYEISYFTNYIFGQILAAGPFSGWLLLWSAFRYQPISLTDRAMKFTLFGIYLFFLATSFKYKVEVNWTVAAYISLIVLSHQYLNSIYKLRKWLYLFLPITLLFVFANRVMLISDSQFAVNMTRSEFHGNKTAAQKTAHLIGNLPLVITNSYQKSSKFRFYTMHPSFSLNTSNYHMNSYNYWDIEDSLIGHPAYIIGQGDSMLNESLNLPLFPEVYGGRINNYYSFSRIRFNDIQFIDCSNGKLQLKCTLNTPSAYINTFQQKPYDTTGIYIALYNSNNDVSSYHKCDLILKEIIQTTMIKQFYTSSFPGVNCKARIVVGSCLPGLFTINSNKFTIVTK